MRLFYIVLAVGGVIVTAFTATQLYAILRDGVIERRPGLKPVSPQSGAVLYWFAVGVMAAGTAIILWGIAVIISRLLSTE